MNFRSRRSCKKPARFWIGVGFVFAVSISVTVGTSLLHSDHSARNDCYGCFVEHQLTGVDLFESTHTVEVLSQPTTSRAGDHMVSLSDIHAGHTRAPPLSKRFIQRQDLSLH